MHTLHLLRHAKSSWKDDLEDHQRPLNRRGREAAQHLGRSLPTRIGDIDLALCSSAVRTRETLDLVLAGFSPRPRCSIEDGLYLADCDKLFKRLRRLDESDRNVLLVGHNPGLHELAVALAAGDAPLARALASGKFPTAARASLRVSTTWRAVADERHALFDYALVGSASGGED